MMVGRELPLSIGRNLAISGHSRPAFAMHLAAEQMERTRNRGREPLHDNQPFVTG